MNPVTGGRGFTMLEIVAVLLVLSVLAAVVGSRFATSVFEVPAAADRLEGHLRYAQSRAINTETRWGINLLGDRYFLFHHESIANKARLPGEASDEVALPSGCSVTAGLLSFDTWGAPFTDAAAAAPQVGLRELTLSAPSGETAKITIEPNTGHVH